jgi:saccharopine dehydrogenase-like NADP-dependent oxidoreductase
MKYRVTDETGRKVILETEDLKEASRKARELFFKGVREHGYIEHFKVWNTRLGTLAYMTS